MSSKTTRRHHVAGGDKATSQPQQKWFLDAGPEGVDIKSVALGVKDLSLAKPLGREGLAEGTNPCRPPPYPR